MSMEFLFNPRSVALIGSSKMRIEGSMVSPEIFKKISDNLSEFPGELFVADIDSGFELPGADLTIITLPSDRIIEILDKLNTKVVLILSGNFTKEQNLKVSSISKKRGFRVLGPNSVCGVINPEKSLNTTFEIGLNIKSGCISVISQSGGIGATILDLIIHKKIGISKFVWIGNAVDINENDLLEFLIKDEKTKVISLYLESLKDPRKFMDIAKKSRKPIIVLKGGLSKESQKRALTHTDSLSTSSDIYSAAFRQSGVIETESLGELFNYAVIFEKRRDIKNNRIAIISNTGGSSILASDWCYKYGLNMAGFSEVTKKEINRKYPEISLINPLDIIADADGKRYKDIVDVVVKDKNVDAVLIIAQLKSCLLKPEELELLKRIKTLKTVVACAPGAEDFDKVRFFLGDCMPVFSSVKNAVKSIKNLYEFKQMKQ